MSIKKKGNVGIKTLSFFAPEIWYFYQKITNNNTKNITFFRRKIKDIIMRYSYSYHNYTCKINGLVKGYG